MLKGRKVDPNNPKLKLKINKYCENRSEYFEYHKKVAEAFKQDCEKLLLAFESRKDLRFTTFAAVWQELSFSLVFVGQEFIEELSLFAESCFFAIKKYIICCKKIHIQVGAFYLLYGIFSKQLSKDIIKIRITHDEYKALLNLVKKMQYNGANDFVYIFNKLKLSDAFHFVATTRCFGLEAKFTWQERQMKDDIFQDTVKNSPLKTVENVLFGDDDFNLRDLDKVTQEYEKAMNEYAIATSSKPILIQPTSTAVRDVEDLLHQLQNEFKDLKAYVPESKQLEEDTIAVKRQKIREKAFQATGKPRNA